MITREKKTIDERTLFFRLGETSRDLCNLKRELKHLIEKTETLKDYKEEFTHYYDWIESICENLHPNYILEE